MDDSEFTMAEAMFEALDNLEPVVNAADGLRTKLIGLGWSEDAAEAAGVSFVQAALAAFFE